MMMETICRYCGKSTTTPISLYYCSVPCRGRYYWYKREGGVGIACLVCGKVFKRPVRHAQMAHGLSAREYKEEFGLDVKRGILLPEDRQLMADHTKSNGTVANLKSGEKFWFKKGESNNYSRSPQTIARLKKQWAWARELSPANKKGGWRSGKNKSV